MQPACRAAIGPGARLAEAALLALDDNIGRQKTDQVGGVFHQTTRAFVQAQLIRRVACDAGIVDGDDLGMRQQNDNHAAGTTKPITGAQDIEP